MSTHFGAEVGRARLRRVIPTCGGDLRALDVAAINCCRGFLGHWKWRRSAGSSLSLSAHAEESSDQREDVDQRRGRTINNGWCVSSGAPPSSKAVRVQRQPQCGHFFSGNSVQVFLVIWPRLDALPARDRQDCMEPFDLARPVMGADC